ncbi:hypothetical protein BDR04DRAFT_1103130 [Suillus decipiens]|nr:hypothetical protein BDR04DRAFT_1109113 [Suillus decipiens]KAG2068492.1 hypothetical protein BDR04DRAFT_1103130 [Suillus decipiens]
MVFSHYAAVATSLWVCLAKNLVAIARFRNLVDQSDYAVVGDRLWWVEKWTNWCTGLLLGGKLEIQAGFYVAHAVSMASTK